MNAASGNPVGRPRSFDEDEVLTSVMNVFWRKGYDGTSMNDLLTATGLHKGSIYQSFGDKHSLFIRALRVYVDDMRRMMQQKFDEAECAVEGLRAMLYHHIGMGTDTEGTTHPGCLALNSLVESAPHDPEVMSILGATMRMRMKLISEAVMRAQAEGDMRSDWKTDRIARLLIATEAGILVQMKGMLTERRARAMADDLLAALA